MVDKRVLSIGVPKESLERVSPELNRGDYAVEVVPTPRSGLTLLEEIRFDLVVLAHPQSELDVRRFIDALRADDCVSKKAKLLIVATDTASADLQRLRERNLEVISRDDSLIGDLANQVLSGDPRVQLSVIVKLAADLPYGTSQRICQSENLSISGLLVRASDTLPVGTSTRIELKLPGAEHSMRLAGRVVRLTGAGEIPGIALRFENLTERNRDRLETFIERSSR